MNGDFTRHVLPIKIDEIKGHLMNGIVAKVQVKCVWVAMGPMTEDAVCFSRKQQSAGVIVQDRSANVKSIAHRERGVRRQSVWQTGNSVTVQAIDSVP